MIFFNKQIEKKLKHIHNNLHTSFHNVKKDHQRIFSWIDFLYKKNLQQEHILKSLQEKAHHKELPKDDNIKKFYEKLKEQESTIRDLKYQLNLIPKDKLELKTIIEEIFSIEELRKKLSEINIKIEHLYSKPQIQPQIAKLDHYEDVYERLANIQKKVEDIEKKKISARDRIIQKIAKNTKDYIKNTILSYIAKYEKISAQRLREMIVDEQNLCSKSSFYRLLEELEERDDISVIKTGKIKHYLIKQSKRV